MGGGELRFLGDTAHQLVAQEQHLGRVLENQIRRTREVFYYQNVRSIGVSDFTIKDLMKLMKTAKVVPAVNQVSYPCKYVQNASLLEFSAKFNIVTEAYHSVLLLHVHSDIWSWCFAKFYDRAALPLSCQAHPHRTHHLEWNLAPLTAQEILDIEREGARGPLDGRNLIDILHQNKGEILATTSRSFVYLVKYAALMPSQPAAHGIFMV
ncbi:hypothetical protein JB92DRAFT_2832770 [Gautieria morchelliformis]|nr:hypothetical protein JB92DRAFT_2832770 [Gautieria morchelliformis]